MQLDLWLDESGDFKSDDKQHLNPSLVGGVLVQRGIISEEKAREINGKDFIHYNREPAAKNIRMLEKIRSLGAECVIFQNKERVKIIDGDTTYLNVLAEGIIQLLLRLSAMYGDFELNVLIATRKNVTRGHGIIPAEEYTGRLREKIIVGLARKFLTRKNSWNYTIEFDDARESARLMLADGVCNTYLTQTSGKFTAKQKEQIKKLYDERFIFSFYEDSAKVEIEQKLAEGNIGDVIFECYLEENKALRPTHLPLALKQLSALDEYGQENQLRLISTKIDTFIRIDRNYEFVRPILIDMQEDLLPQLKAYEIHMPQFDLDIILYLYSLYTHEGSVKALRQDELFAEKLQDMKDIMLKFEYFNMYKLRRSVNQKNLLDIKGSIEDATQAITVLDEMVALMDLLDDSMQRTGDEESQMFDTLGKAYGTRGQAYTMLIHEDEQYLQRAIADFDQALSHFYVQADRERQYIYKAQAYSEAGEIEKAIDCLYDACYVDRNQSYEELLQKLQQGNLRRDIFKYHIYFKIMAQAAISGENDVADQLYAALVHTKTNLNQLKAQYEMVHPMQFILWNFAIYLFEAGRDQLAHQSLDRAIERCESPFSGQTIQVIQLGLYAEKLLRILPLKRTQQENDLKERMNQLLKKLQAAPNAEYIFTYLKKVTMDQLKDPTFLQTILRLTRCIN